MDREFGIVPDEIKKEEEKEIRIWRPKKLQPYEDRVAVGASTKNLTKGFKQDHVLRFLGNEDRFDDEPEGMSLEDREEHLKKRLRAARALVKFKNELDPEVDSHHIVKSKLTHSSNIFMVDAEFVKDLHKGNLENKQIIDTDGLITDLPGYPLYVSAADCYPVVLFDPEHNAVGLFHAGYYGTRSKIVEKGIAKMTEQYATDPNKLIAVIGPGVSGDYYEVPQKSKDDFETYYGEPSDQYFTPVEGKPGFYTLDLEAALLHTLKKNGVDESKIEVSQYKTNKDNDLFPSARLEADPETKKDLADRFGLMVVLK